MHLYSGRRRCELFLEIPSKKLYPDYYVLIETPIALDIINVCLLLKYVTHKYRI